MGLICDAYVSATEPTPESETGLPLGWPIGGDETVQHPTAINQNFLVDLVKASGNVEYASHALSGTAIPDKSNDPAFTALYMALSSYTDGRLKGRYALPDNQSQEFLSLSATWTRLDFSSALLVSQTGVLLVHPAVSGTGWWAENKTSRTLHLRLSAALNIHAPSPVAGLRTLSAQVNLTDASGEITGAESYYRLHRFPGTRAQFVAGDTQILSLSGTTIVSIPAGQGFCLEALFEPGDTSDHLAFSPMYSGLAQQDTSVLLSACELSWAEV